MTAVIDSVLPALGGSVIYDEHKGDLAEARRLADAAVSEARASSEGARLADALLERGIVHLLKGEASAATASLGEASGLVPGDPARCARAAIYSAYAAYWRDNLFPDGGGSYGTAFEARMPAFLQVVAAQHARAGQEAARVSAPELSVELALVDLLCALLSARRFVSRPEIVSDDQRRALP